VTNNFIGCRDVAELPRERSSLVRRFAGHVETTGRGICRRQRVERARISTACPLPNLERQT
jgi:hypothetical protein